MSAGKKLYMSLALYILQPSSSLLQLIYFPSLSTTTLRSALRRFARHYDASLSTTTLRSALRRFAQHYDASLGSTSLRSALRHFAQHYDASLGTTSLRSALKNLETKFQKITFFLRFKWICIKLVRKSGEFSGRAEIPFWLSDRPEKSGRSLFILFFFYGHRSEKSIPNFSCRMFGMKTPEGRNEKDRVFGMKVV